MRRATGVMLLAVLGMTSPCQADTIRAESAITAVTVFPDRAAVTRTAALKLDRGPQTIEIGPLPSGVEADSVAAKGSGEARVTLYGVRVTTRQLETAQDPKVKSLEEEIRKARRRQQSLRTTKQVVEQERKYLASIQAASSEQIGKDLITKSPSAADAAALLAFLDESLLKNAERDQEADVALEQVAQELDKLQRELATLTQGQRRQETLVAVDLDAQEGGSFQLEVSYRLFGASWEPGYEARVAAASDQVELASYGWVRQQTGEGWTDVRLTLSTAKPAVAGAMPELQPWFLKPWEPVLYERGRRAAKPAPLALGVLAQKDEAREEPFDNVAASKAVAAGAAHVASAAVETQGPSVSFVLPKPVSVPSDWQPHKAPIGVRGFAASLAYETTPRLSPSAFLRAKVTNTTDLLYLAGPVSVFLDGAFIATAALKQVAPGELFDLYLGVDERVKVERKSMKERVEVSLLPGLRGKTTSTEYEFLTTLQNYTGRKASVTVFDQVPVSQREEIVVESVQPVPSEVTKDEEKPGVFRWQVELAPSQKQELRLSYRVRHPVDMQVQ